MQVLNEAARIQRLEREAADRRAILEAEKRLLAQTTAEYKRTRADSDGNRVAEAESRLRLAKLALDGVEEELRAARRPQRIVVTSPRDELVRQRQQITQRMQYRAKERQERVDHERRRCGFREERHIQAHLANVFGRMRSVEDERDQHTLANIDAQLAELDRRETAVSA